MRLHAGRPGLEPELLELVGSPPVGYFLGLANNDYAPPGPITGSESSISNPAVPELRPSRSLETMTRRW